MSKIVKTEDGKAGPEILVEFTYEDIRKIVISRAIHNAEAEGHSIDFNDVSFFNFSWAPGMSARVRLSLKPEAQAPLGNGAS